ncbi:MAG: CDP-alcohol phosphatidyltransferase [Roseibaca calidilacus]|uniref:CDP-alcohol phosphatidyltransferase n=1 Tax=Roseibaca calidilacus TaxID=1666912 RepID=A0A0P7YR42_9RHOB|nr:CDP-alcohol phosphatidyltransferase family protein [Roseibaca calidilacus]KPP92771.1 MAG: CDP-alcohol phosphatidyltransferase [Roseibaca calidilacus]CUX80156.1 Phosphatidylglycerophosphate synthase [Roseibaca calidilacus]
MLDRHLRPYIDPPLNMIGGQIARSGLTANMVTLIGLAFGLAAGGAIVAGHFLLAVALILASRVADGLDGAVARAQGVTDFGGYLDITCDFVFYAAIPLAFVLHDPASNGVAGAVLLASFYINGASFLGYAILAEKKKMRSDAHGVKSLYFTGGLLEGAETIAFFVALCLWPGWFAAMAYGFAALCGVTALSRILLAARVFER